MSALDLELRATVSWSRTAAAGTHYTVVFIRRSGTNDYRLKVVGYASGTIQLSLVRRVGGAETTLRTANVSGVSLAAATDYKLAFRAVTSGGATNLAAKLWRSGTTEPSWTLAASDETATLQKPGSLGFNSYLSSSATAAITTRVDDLLAEQAA